MSGIISLVGCASLLLVQSISAQSFLAQSQLSPCAQNARPRCASLGLGNLGLGNQGLGNLGLGNVGLGNQGLGYLGLSNQGLGNLGLGNQGLCNQGLGNLGVGNQGLGLSALGSGANVGLSSPLGYNNEEVFTVAFGSATTPSGLSLLADNLEISGPVGVQASLPFLTTVGVAGDLPTNGQALVSYTAGPEVALTTGGCGQGLELGGVSGYGSGLGLANAGLANVGLGNVGLASGLGLANGGLASGLGLANSGLASGLGLTNGRGLGASTCGFRY